MPVSQQNLDIKLYLFSSFPFYKPGAVSFTIRKFGPFFAHINPSLVTERFHNFIAKIFLQDNVQRRGEFVQFDSVF